VRQRVLDPKRYFIVIPNQFGNGLSTSPSNLAQPFGLGRNPLFTHWDKVHAQERLLRDKFELASPAWPSRTGGPWGRDRRGWFI
jgi:homoserine acetyltransferase